MLLYRLSNFPLPYPHGISTVWPQDGYAPLPQLKYTYCLSGIGNITCGRPNCQRTPSKILLTVKRTGNEGIEDHTGGVLAFKHVGGYTSL